MKRNRNFVRSVRIRPCYTCPVPLPLVLASQSPRRRELLATAGIPFTIRAREVEEIRAPGEPPDAYARRLACAKADAAWENRAEILLGADTFVVLGDVQDRDVIEKLRNDADTCYILCNRSIC